jgi:hypothetical protein
MNKMPGPIGLMLVGAVFVCLCIMPSAPAAEMHSSLPDLQDELKKSSSVPFRQIPEMQHRLRELAPQSSPSNEKVDLLGSSPVARVSDLKAINTVKQRDVIYDEAQGGDPESQGLLNSMDISITGQEPAKSDMFGKGGSGDDIEQIVDDAFNNRIGNRKNDGRTERSQQIGNNMNIEVSGISVSALNTVPGGSAVATSNIIIRPVQIIVSPSEVEEKLK